MGFLRRHFEKIILGISLISLLVSCYYLLYGLRLAAQDVEKVQEKAEKAVAGGKLLEALQEDQFQAPKVLAAPGITVAVTAPQNSPALFAPTRYMRCLNPQCNYLFPFEHTKECPFCQTKQPTSKPTGPVGPDPREDTDGDKIPDIVEQEKDFLHEEDPSDAYRDQDKDGFTNLEEYSAEPPTKMDDIKSYPPLAVNLRYLKYARVPIPLMFKRVSTNNSDDPSRWDIACVLLVRGRQNPKVLRVGSKALGYEILNVQREVKSGFDRRRGKRIQYDVFQMVVKDEKTGEEYVLEADKPAYQKNALVTFVFMGSRSNKRTWQTLTARVGSEFQLTHAPTGEIQKYEVTDIRPGAIEVTRRDPDVEVKEFYARKLDMKTDLIYYRPSGYRTRRTP